MDIIIQYLEAEGLSETDGNLKIFFSYYVYCDKYSKTKY